jgi:hypothetical protein
MIGVIGAVLVLDRRRVLAWPRRLRMATAGVAGASVVTAFAFEVGVRGPVTIATALGVEGGSGRSTDVASALRGLEAGLLDWVGDLIGIFGWVDHGPPPMVVLGWITLIAVLFIIAVRVGGREEVAGLAIVTVGALAVAPLFVIAQFVPADGYQARYHLPLAVAIPLGAAAIGLRPRSPGDTALIRRVLGVGTAAASLGMVLTVIGSFHRYRVGGSPTMLDLFELISGSGTWAPPGAVLLSGLVCLALCVPTALLMVRPTDAETP